MILYLDYKKKIVLVLTVSSVIPYDIQKEWLDLVQEIRTHNRLYYEEDRPIISDAAYDALYRRLVFLERRFPGLVTLESPTQIVGGKLQAKSLSVNHWFPLYSLDNAYTLQEVEQFHQRIVKSLSKPAVEYVVEGKVDGLTLVLQYEAGVLIGASTRGNGKAGEDVSTHLPHIEGIPKFINKEEIRERLEIRGEVYIEKEDFDQCNRLRLQGSERAFANARNAAAGALRHLDAQHSQHRGLKFAVHGVWPAIRTSYTQALEQLKAWGFSSVPFYGVYRKISDLDGCFQEALAHREHYPWELDGLVYKVNAWDDQETLGYTAKSPRFAIAHKFPAPAGITQLHSIEIQVGRTGTLTPVAILAPILLGGVTITRASLHNEDEIQKKDLRVGDFVRIHRAGDVIPQVCEVIKPMRQPGSVPFCFPRTCPACGAEVLRMEGEVSQRCIAGLQCSAQVMWALRHFVSKDALDIEGLGPKNIRFLYEYKFLTAVQDLFTLHQHHQEWSACEGWGQKSVALILNAIDKKRQNLAVERFLYGLSIPHVGKVTASIVAQTLSLHSLLTLPQSDLSQALLETPGIGPIVAQSITQFVYNNSRAIQAMMAHITFSNVSSASTQALPWSSLKLVFTGTFEHATRKEMVAKAQQLGAHISDHVSQDTTYVVVGAAPGAKYQRAQALRVSVLQEEEWLQMVQPFS
jgi:DNA ligase (NAD+)